MGRKRTAKLAPVLEDNGTDADTYASAMSGKIVPEAVQRIVDELEAQVMERVQAILSKAEDDKISIRNEFKLQLLKLSKRDRTSQLVDFQAKHASTIRADLLHDIQTRLQAGGGQLPMAPTEPVHAPETTTMPTTSAAPPTAMAKGTVMTRKRGGILAAAAANAAVKQSGPMSTPTTRGSSARLPKHGEVFYSENGSPLGTYEQAHANAPGYLATPMVGGGVHQAPVAVGNNAGSMVTIVKTNAKRRGARTKQDTALSIVTSDGQQVVLDDGAALANLPAARRKEVETQLRALQRLTNVALGKR